MDGDDPGVTSMPSDSASESLHPADMSSPQVQNMDTSPDLDCVPCQFVPSGTETAMQSGKGECHQRIDIGCHENADNCAACSEVNEYTSHEILSDIHKTTENAQETDSVLTEPDKVAFTGSNEQSHAAAAEDNGFTSAITPTSGKNITLFKCTSCYSE